jgi:O-glycosyl hydrolase
VTFCARIFFFLLAFLPACVQADYTAIVSPASVLTTNFAGWGVSLCWWANVVGGYSNRDDYVNRAFAQLQLNIVRYNIGGGENPSLTNTIMNYRAIMQGFEPANGTWSWNVDANQRWVLRQAVALGANQVVAFANSPPWWMTVSGSVTGAVGGTNNLQVAYEDAFAVYLATVVSNLTVLDGVHFDYVTPMNEPTDAWAYDNGKQEGCHMANSQQSRVVGYLRSELNSCMVSSAIDAPEDYSEQNSISDLAGYAGSSLGGDALMTTHTYSANNPGGLKSIAASLGRPLWVSEYGDGDGTGMTMAQRIHDDITGMGLQAWIYWQVVDNAGGWGFLYNPLTTNSTGGFTTNYTINEKFYVMGQFSEFIRPGCKIINVNDANTLAAYNPTNQTLVLVTVNTNSSSFNVTYSLNAFASTASRASVFQTDSGENLQALSALPVALHQFTSAIPSESVTTFVLTNVTLLPQIISQPPVFPTNAVILYPGASPLFSISAEGSGSLQYQWRSNGVPIFGATNPAYAPIVVSPSVPNNYVCIVSNFAGSVTTTVWSVSLAPAPIASYPQTVLALHPAGYWRMDETNTGTGNSGVVCHDGVGGNNGVYSNTVLAVAGYSPVADPTGTAANFGFELPTNSAASQIGNIDFSAPPGGNAEFSVTAWAKGGAQVSDAGIVSKGYGGGGEQFNLDTGSDSLASHGFRFFVRDALGNTHGASSPLAPDGNWHFLAGVCDPSNGWVHLYVDGVDRADGAFASGLALLAAPPGSVPGANLVTIGARAANKSSASFTNQFLGSIDEVAIYNQPLSSSQVQALYAAAPVPAIRLVSSGNSATITYTGTLLCSTNVAGVYANVIGAASPYPVPATGFPEFYRTSNP